MSEGRKGSHLLTFMCMVLPVYCAFLYNICVARFMDLSTICGFLGQKIVCGWIKAKSSVDFSAYGRFCPINFKIVSFRQQPGYIITYNDHLPFNKNRVSGPQ